MPLLNIRIGKDDEYSLFCHSYSEPSNQDTCLFTKSRDAIKLTDEFMHKEDPMAILLCIPCNDVAKTDQQSVSDIEVKEHRFEIGDLVKWEYGIIKFAEISERIPTSDDMCV